MDTFVTLKGFGKYKINIGEYTSNGNTAVTLYSVEFPWDYIKLSLNPQEPLPSEFFVVKNYSENLGIPEQVFPCGLFEDTGEIYAMSFGQECPIWKLKPWSKT